MIKPDCIILTKQAIEMIEAVKRCEEKSLYVTKLCNLAIDSMDLVKMELENLSIGSDFTTASYEIKD